MLYEAKNPKAKINSILNPINSIINAYLFANYNLSN